MTNSITPKPDNSSRRVDIGIIALLMSFVSFVDGTFFLLFYVASRGFNIWYSFDYLFYMSLVLWPLISIVGIVVGLYGAKVRHNFKAKWGFYIEIVLTIFFGMFWSLLVYYIFNS